MVINLLNFIGDEIKDRNLYFDKYDSIAFQQADGKVYKFTTSQEREFCGLSDASGIAFYIKINPVATFTQGRQLTSTKQISQGTIECNLIAYKAASEINTINWQSKIAGALKDIDFSVFTGREKHIKIEIKSTSNNSEEIFKEETGKELDTELKIISIKYNLLFSSNEFNCGECNIFGEGDCSQSTQEICDQFVARINNLPIEAQECIKEEICDNNCESCPPGNVFYSDGVTLIASVPCGGNVTSQINYNPYDQATINFMNAIGIPNDDTVYYPSTAYEITGHELWDAVNDMITDFKTAGIWDKMIAIYPHIGGTALRHSFNLKNPLNFQLAFFGGWTFSATGSTPNGVNGYADTEINLQDDMSQDDISMGFISGIDSEGVKIDMGAESATTVDLWSRSNAAGGFVGRLNNQAVYTPFSVSDSLGNYFVTRLGSVVSLYKNGILLTSYSAASTGELNMNAFIGARNNALIPGNYSDREQRMTFFGLGINATEVTNMNTIINLFQTALGR